MSDREFPRREERETMNQIVLIVVATLVVSFVLVEVVMPLTKHHKTPATSVPSPTPSASASVAAQLLIEVAQQVIDLRQQVADLNQKVTRLEGDASNSPAQARVASLEREVSDLQRFAQCVKNAQAIGTSMQLC